MPIEMLAVVAMAASMALAVLVFAWRQPDSDGLRLWGGGLVVLTGGLALLGATTASGWRAVAGSVLVALAHASAVQALCRFHQRPCSPWQTLAPVVAVALLAFFFMHRPAARMGWCGAVFALQWGLVARSGLLQRSGPLERGRWLLAVGAGLAVAVYAARTVALALGAGDAAGVAASGSMRQLSLLVAVPVLVFLTFGYVLMSKERVDAAFRQSARLDPLTGVPNRSAFLDVLQHAVAQAARAQRPVALLMADIDKFKHINDTHGHLAGDAVLAAVARCLQANLRAQDTLGRYGGEEFLVLLPDTDAAGACLLAEHLRQSVAQMQVPWEGQHLCATISIGVRAQVPAGVHAVQTLIDQADQAMYAAKRGGRNRVELAAGLVALPPGAAVRGG